MDKAKLYSSRIISSYVEYLKKYLPEINIESILKYAEIEQYQLDDEGHWLSQEQIDRFHDEISKQSDQPNIAREVGRFAVNSKASGTLGQYMLGFISPATAYSFVEKINARISHATVLKTKSIGPDEIEVKAVLMPDVAEKPYQCQYRLGTLEALAKLFTKKFAAIEHPVCTHKGGDCCLYRIKWEKTNIYFWKKIRNYSFIFSILALGFLRPFSIDVIVLLCIIIAVGATLYSDHMEKKELHLQIIRQGDASDRLLDQIEKRSNETLLIQEIGQTASMILKTDELLKCIMESIEKRLDFDRGMVMLADKKKASLVYAVSYGYNPKDENYLKSIEFHLDNPGSKGTAVNVFKKQIPVLVNDISEIEKDLSPKSRDFLRDMRSRSFICVPIVYKSESMGILIVDNVQSKKPLSQTDMNFFIGIAQQIGISINNAIYYQQISESEEQFRALSENAPDIIYTLDPEGVCTYVNPAWERILGHPEEVVLGRYIVDFVKKEDVGTIIRAFNEIRESRRRVTDLYGTLLHKEGSERMFHMSGAPNTDSGGNVTGVVGTLKDVTDLKKSEADLRISIQKQKSMIVSTVEVISNIGESRDLYTAGHQKRVAALAVAIALELGYSDERVESLRMGSLIHDIGKIHIPAEILSKPGKLSDIEFNLMKTHPEQGYNILKQADFIQVIATMVYQHHERIDGSGYPNGIKGDEILPESCIIAVADTVEAMASHRPYRASLGIKPALEEIKKRRGHSYDADVVDACLRLFMEKGFEFRDDRAPFS